MRQLDGRHQLFAATALAGSMDGYRIVLSADVEDFFADWRRTSALFLLLCGAVSVVFAAALYLVLRRMNRPLQNLTETARQIAGGDYAARTPVAAARRDELGELGRTLNDASARIQRQLAQLSAGMAAHILNRIPVLFHLERNRKSLKRQDFCQNRVAGGRGLTDRLLFGMLRHSLQIPAHSPAQNNATNESPAAVGAVTL